MTEKLRYVLTDTGNFWHCEIETYTRLDKIRMTGTGRGPEEAFDDAQARLEAFDLHESMLKAQSDKIEEADGC